MSCSSTPPPDAIHFDDFWLTETVLALARGVAADLAFDRLPILADALEDAGCDNFALLNHLRSDEPHEIGCWALRRLLRTTLLLPGNVPITFAYCPPGSFLMGHEHPHALDDERPAHSVTLTKGFHAGVHPVTQDQWRAVMGTNPSLFKGDRRPVERVSWDDASRFCHRTTELLGSVIRLPTEAEWEYACRAGTMTPFHWGENWQPGMMTHTFGGDGPGTTDVGLFLPNPWGLHDCHGNVREWCADWYDAGWYSSSPAVDPMGPREGRYRSCRGGSWYDNPALCTAYHRGKFEQDRRNRYFGFRVVFTAT